MISMIRHDQQMRSSKKKSYPVVTFVASSLVSFFNLWLSMKCAKNSTKVVYKLGVLAHFAPWGILGLGLLAHIRHKKSDKKN